MLLAIETTLGPFSIALLDGDKVLSSYYHEAPHMQAELLVPSITALIKGTCEYDDIKHIAVAVGPGSFTGIRIGIAAAQGIALATGCGVVGVSTLEAMATGGPQDKVYKVALRAGRGQMYCQEFQREGGTIEPICAPSLIDEGGFHSNGGDIVLLDLCNCYPLLSAQRVGLVANCKLARKELHEASPLYIREPDAKVPMKRA
jgi:tRNA threonylcarbamoyl adenosine modification protein YeaZ